MPKVNLRCRGPKAVLRYLAAVLVVSQGLSLSATRIYSLQSGAFPTQQEANDASSKLSATCSPVFVRQVNDDTAFPYKVLVGQFPVYAQAWAYKSALPEGAIPGVFITICDEDISKLASNNIPVAKPFTTLGLNQPEPLTAPAYWAAGGWAAGGTNQSSNPDDSLLAKLPVLMSRTELLTVGMSAANNPTQGVAALNQFIAAYPIAPETNRAKLVLARVLGRGADLTKAESLLADVSKSGTIAEKGMADFLSAHVKYNRHDLRGAHNAFVGISNNVSLPPSMRREAMKLAAATSHALHLYPEAWLAYEQIRDNAVDSTSSAEAAMQLAGLAYELTGCGKGDWGSVGQMCLAAEDNPGASHNDQATAALMHLETLYEQGKYVEALAEIQEFYSSFSDVKREYYLAQIWEGVCYGKLHAYDQAQAALVKLMAAPIAKSDKFAQGEPRARGAIWLAWAANRKGDIASRDQWVNVLKTEFPNSEECQRARTLFGS